MIVARKGEFKYISRMTGKPMRVWRNPLPGQIVFVEYRLESWCEDLAFHHYER
jgi:hypothetical protein